jgi:serpin B
MIRRLRSDRLLAALAVMALLGGCASSATLPPSPTSVVTPSASAANSEPTPTTAPTEQPTASPLGSQEPSPSTAPDLAISTVARAPADPAAAKTAAASINAFGLDLFRQLLADPQLGLAHKNAVFSPTSIALALGMARAGAKGDTASQMDAVLHTAGWDALGPGLNSLDRALASRDATWQDYEGTEHALALRIANAAYGQQGWKIEQAYLDAIASAFGAGLRLVDFITNRDAARKAINAWVSDQTAKRIPQLLGPTDLDSRTRLVLVNAIYLKANWEQEFSADETKPAPFTRLDGTPVTVPTMYTVRGGGVTYRPIPYAHGSGWQAVELRYKGGAGYGNAPLAMTLVLPDDLAAFEKSLNAAQLERISSALANQRKAFGKPGFVESYPYDLHLYLPRFSIETRADLPPVLDALGMPLAFDPEAADFTGIHVHENVIDRLYISRVIHQANIDVNEKGTEAAAATAVVMATGGGPSPLKEITLRLDHPFLFFVRDLDTGAVLFMGQVTDPSAPKGS